MRRFTIGFAFAGFFVLNAAATHGAEPPPVNVSAELAANDNVIKSFEVEGNGDFLLIPVTVGDRVYSFVVDTGSTESVFDASLKGALRPTGEQTLINGKGTVQIYDCGEAVVGISRLSLGKRAFCVDLSAVRTGSGLEFSGVVGMGFLRNYVLQIDFGAGRLTLLRSAEGVPGVELPIEIDSAGTPTVSVDLPHLGKLPFVIDTGRSNFGDGELETTTFRSLFLLKSINSVTLIDAFTIDSVARIWRRTGFVEGISVAGNDFKRQIFDSGDTNLLGLGFLSRYTVTFDFPRNRMFLANGKQFDRVFSHNETGVAVEKSEGNLIVSYIDKSGLGYSNGIRIGHRFLKIDGEDAQKVTLFTARLTMRQPKDGLRLQVIGKNQTVARDICIRRKSAKSGDNRDNQPAVENATAGGAVDK